MFERSRGSVRVYALEDSLLEVEGPEMRTSDRVRVITGGGAEAQFDRSGASD